MRALRPEHFRNWPQIVQNVDTNIPLAPKHRKLKLFGYQNTKTDIPLPSEHRKNKISLSLKQQMALCNQSLSMCCVFSQMNKLLESPQMITVS